MNFWKTGSFAHSKLPVILFSTTAVHNFIPKNTFSRMLAALCDTSQIHLYGSTCSQHIHPSPLCTFGADPSDCRKSIWSPSLRNCQGKNPWCVKENASDNDKKPSYWKLSSITYQINHTKLCVSKNKGLKDRNELYKPEYLCAQKYYYEEITLLVTENPLSSNDDHKRRQLNFFVPLFEIQCIWSNSVKIRIQD